MQVFASRKMGCILRLLDIISAVLWKFHLSAIHSKWVFALVHLSHQKINHTSVISLRDSDLGRWDLRQVEKHLCSWTAPGCGYCSQKHSNDLCLQFTSASAALGFFWSHCAAWKHRCFCWGLKESWRALAHFKSPSETQHSSSSQTDLLDILIQAVWHLPGFYCLCSTQQT